MSANSPVVMLCHSGSSFSTSDVVTGVRAGLEANGVKVVTFPLHINLQMMNLFVDFVIEEGIVNEPIDPFSLAQRGIADMAIHYEIDAFLAISGSNLHPMAPLTLRNLAAQRRKPFPVAVYTTESPYQLAMDVTTAKAYDLVFCNERLSLPHYLNERVHYLPHAYNPLTHTPDGPKEHADAFFVGTGFEERRALFAGVDWSGIDFRKLGYGWEGWDNEDVISPKNVLPNEDAAAWYRGAKVSINHHRTTRHIDTGHITSGEAESIGPRAYEIAACGGFQLCDDSRPELIEVFRDSAATYAAGDSADLEKQLRWWLAHDREREEWAAAQHEQIKPHTWAARAATLLNILLD